jgi:hypothetical protein
MVNAFRTMLMVSSLALAVVVPQTSVADTLPRWRSGIAKSAAALHGIRFEDSLRRDFLLVDPQSASWLLRGDNKAAASHDALRFDTLRYPRSPDSGFSLSISPGAPCTPVCVKLIAAF